MIKKIIKDWIMPRPKVIVIAGTTGVGKSDLSIQIATKYNGEVINSDSMQMYKGIPVITNKHPIEERNGVKHHLMNHVSWDEEYYIHRFEQECTEAIQDIHSRGKMPIIVGGTHYYLQTLFNKRVNERIRNPNAEETKILDSNDAKLVYDTLKSVDPTIASKFHINDIRRVKRMLEIYYTTGEKPSEAFEKQDTSLKYDTLFFWIYSKPEILDKRLDLRVDKMMDLGALEEIKELYAYYKEHKFTAEKCENGVWQVIGFKEFLPWLNNPENCDFNACVEKMKIRTRQYAKRQVKWIKKMLMPDIDGKIYILDATDLEQWNVNVSQRASSIIEDFTQGRSTKLPYAPEMLSSLLIHDSQNSPKLNADWKQYTCDICKDKDNKNLIAIGTKNWEIHLKSRRHKANINKQHKKLNFEKWQKRKIEEVDH